MNWRPRPAGAELTGADRVLNNVEATYVQEREVRPLREGQINKLPMQGRINVDCMELRSDFPEAWQGLNLRFRAVPSKRSIEVQDCQDWRLDEYLRMAKGSAKRDLVIQGSGAKEHCLNMTGDHSVDIEIFEPVQVTQPLRQLNAAVVSCPYSTDSIKKSANLRAWLNQQRSAHTSFSIQANGGTVKITRLNDIEWLGDDVKLIHEGGEDTVSLAKGSKFLVSP